MKHLTFILCLFVIGGYAQKIDPFILTKPWSASWVAVPEQPAKDYGVYLFRKTLELSSKPQSFVVHVSADNRYKLYINEQLVSLGPARSDLYYWNFETVDIAPYLKIGKNAITAVVWNEGEMRPEGQMSYRTGFLIQGDTDNEAAINSNNTWKCMKDNSYSAIAPGVGYPTYYVAGPGEKIDMRLAVANWQAANYDDSKWLSAKNVMWNKPSPKGIGDINGWMLVPSPLPQMELKPQRFGAVRQGDKLTIPAAFPAEKATIVVPKKSKVSLLLDQNELTNAYPMLHFNKGEDAEITISYAEALYNTVGVSKGNRNEIEGKKFAGRKDIVVSNGTDNQIFTTLSYRTFRYIKIDIETKKEALEITDLYSVFTGYPFQLKARVETENSEMGKIMEVGWRTARLCAMETYMDCPYYEQLQYIGDTRIQALVSFYNSGDDRLVRNALEQMDHSRIAEGITLSRHPSFSPQQIPTFSLWYIGMLQDYLMYRGDEGFVADKLQGVRNILWFFEKHQQTDGSLKNVPYWIFTDWVKNKTFWKNGVGPIGENGNSALLDFQLLWALQIAAQLEAKIGTAIQAKIYEQKAIMLQNTIRKKYWDATKGLFADTPEKGLYSQHSNALAILTNTIKGKEATDLSKKLLTDQSLAPASIYFRFYLHQALVKAGLGSDYLKWLDDWRENIKMGLTTWAEISEIDAARSDCHAWGASPNIEFFRVILGIDSDAVGFRKVKVEPHLGELTKIGGTMPHPKGEIKASYQLEKSKWNISIELPNATMGTLIWKGKSYPLKSGGNSFKI